VKATFALEVPAQALKEALEKAKEPKIWFADF
jgi:hypothetical protein